MKKITLLFVALLACLQVVSQSEKISEEVKTHAQALVDTEHNVGIVIAFINGDTVDFFSVGTTDLQNNIPVNEQSVFEIGSISKVFTTTLLANEIVNGTMKLTDPISKYLPKEVSVPSRNGREITLLDLATHTSGLPRMPNNFAPKNPNNPYVDYTQELMYAFLSSYELPRDIGSEYEYSNYGMGLLGHILELHTGKSYEDLVIEKIALPCEMPNTKLVFNDYMKSHLAKPHAQGVEVSNWDLTSLAGAGGIRATTKDMVQFIKANMGIFKPSIYDAMAFSQKVAYENNGMKMGLGWNFAQNGKDTVVWHNGATAGYRSFTGFIKGTQKGVVVLGNSDGDIGRLGMKLLGDPRPFSAPKVSIQTVINKEIETNGIQSAIKLYNKLNAESSNDYTFSEEALNTLGYKYAAENKDEIALELFKLNVESYPNASNPYDSLGEMYLKLEDTTNAISNYTKSLQLNPANDNAQSVLTQLGVDTSKLKVDVTIPEATLESYCGKYELQPGFVITITRKDKQLFAQATGQPQFELFASDVNKFYLKVVEAQVTFNTNDNDEIGSLTLHQNGQNMPAKRIK